MCYFAYPHVLFCLPLCVILPIGYCVILLIPYLYILRIKTKINNTHVDFCQKSTLSLFSFFLFLFF